MKKESCVLLGVTGSIAAYKAAELVRLFKKEGMDVHVVMTVAATKFVSALTFRTLSQNPVGVEMFEEPEEWRPEHISLAEKADVFLIAPCSANVMAKLTHGIADDLLTCTALASTAPLVLAPAMNEKMWDNPATVANLDLLKSRGVHIVTVGSGDLACGYQGRGRMATLDDIMTVVNNLIKETE
ncbi:MAG: hypothetical protein KAH23_06960 [Kiritimatiellae bacterium]|nr:hypothetical protein [Kiritimatiellia bacterium]